MIRKGEDLDYLFISILPQIFEKIKFWKCEIRTLVSLFLEFGLLSVENGNVKWFQAYGVLIPKILNKVSKLDDLKDTEKFQILQEIFNFFIEQIKKLQDISDLMSYGFDLAFFTTPEGLFSHFVFIN